MCTCQGKTFKFYKVMRKPGSGMHCILLSAPPQVTSTFHCWEDTVPGSRLFHQNRKKYLPQVFTTSLSGWTQGASTLWPWCYLKLRPVISCKNEKRRKKRKVKTQKWSHGTWRVLVSHRQNMILGTDTRCVIKETLQGDRAAQINFPPFITQHHWWGENSVSLTWANIPTRHYVPVLPVGTGKY